MFTPSQKFTPKLTKDDEKLLKAKEYPLENLYKGELKKTGRVKMGKCPFHNEDTPSFAVYENNTWTCFAGCGSGDVISFYMRINGIDFLTALEDLNTL